MNEKEALALNMNAEAWRKRIEKEAKATERRSPTEAPSTSHALTIEELLGRHVADAILAIE